SQLAFEMNCEHNLVELYEEIKERTYAPSPAICFMVDHPVKREVFASQFRDRVIHHLLYNYLSPIFDLRMIYDCYSCRKGKGTSLGINRFEHHIRSCTDNYRQQAWVLKLDVKDFFMSINRHKLYVLVENTLNRHWKLHPDFDHKRNSGVDRDTLMYLLSRIIYWDPADGCNIRGKLSEWYGLPPSKSLLTTPPGVGLPIGDLTSQLFSNLYLHKLDVFVKHTLCCKHYGRYADDFFIVHPSKTFLRELVPLIRDFLSRDLELILHPKKIYLQECRKGAPFLGSVIKPYRRYAGNRSVKSFNKAVTRISEEIDRYRTANILPDVRWLEQQRSVLNSYLGYFANYKSRKIVTKRIMKSSLPEYFNIPSDCSRAIIRKYRLEEQHMAKK
ncbi:MAG: RNA-directed DNA polymerase, partial [Mediterranea sp.]|nr:RNA-directed DNA polymerase [Mediterranea sp.]